VGVVKEWCRPHRQGGGKKRIGCWGGGEQVLSCKNKSYLEVSVEEG